MAYTPKDWVTGEVITESALDHIEQGIASVVLHVVDGSNTGRLDKTWQEIHDAFVGGSIVTVSLDYPERGVYQMSFVIQMSSEGGSYSLDDHKGTHFVASSADGYPEESFG